MNKYFSQFAFHIQEIFLVLVGAIPGALLRFQLNSDFLSNTVGCAFLGFIVGCQFGSGAKLLLAIGFCGSLTTFSGWMLSLLELINFGFFLQAFNLMILTLFAGFSSLVLGLLIGKKMKQSFIP